MDGLPRDGGDMVDMGCGYPDPALDYFWDLLRYQFSPCCTNSCSRQGCAKPGVQHNVATV